MILQSILLSCGFTSDYDGSAAADSGNAEARTSNGSVSGFAAVKTFIQNFIEYIFGR